MFLVTILVSVVSSTTRDHAKMFVKQFSPGVIA